MRNLGRSFRCPTCGEWWRMDAAGQVVEAAPSRSANAQPVPVSRPVPAKAAPASFPAAPPAPVKPPTPGPKRASRRRKGSASLGDLMGVVWSKGGRRVLAGAGVVGLVVAAFFVYPLIFPSELKARGETVADAWIHQKPDQIERLTAPDQSGNLKRWLDKHPAPDLASLQAPPEVNVAVERNDGRNAEVLVQITTKKKDGRKIFYIFNYHWTQKGGEWYFLPQ